MKTFLILVSIVWAVHLIGQKENLKEFGKITQDEMDMQSYLKDREAGGVILYDRGVSKFIDTDEGYDIKFTRHKRIKIFNQTAFDQAQITIPFYVDGYGKTEKVTSIEAITYNYKDGILDLHQLDPSSVYEEQISQRWKAKKFVFPNVQNGSILEFQYTLETPFQFNLPDWTFQDHLPTMYSEYEVRMIPFYEYVYVAQGITRFDFQESVIAKEKRAFGDVTKRMGRNVGGGVEFQDYVHTYVMKDVPAFRDASYISSINDYIIKLDFQLAKFNSPTGGSHDIISTWTELNKALVKHKLFGKYQKNCKKFAKEVLKDELSIKGLDDQEKCRLIIEYVKNHFVWDGSSSKYSSQSAKDFYNSKSGNSADVNLFLVALLEQAGIEAQPVILSTRNHGKFNTEYPFDHQTNYVVTMINSESIFLADGTENLLAYDRLPTRCLNDLGLVVDDEKESKWVKLNNQIPSLERNLISIEIDKSFGMASTLVTILSTEYNAYVYRDQYGKDTASIKEAYSKKLGEIEKIRVSNFDEVSKPFAISIQGEYELERIGDNFVVNPFLHLPISKNNLTQRRRTYPVDFVYPTNEIWEITIVVPEGYSPTTLPDSFALNNELAEINLAYSQTGNLLKITGNYHFKKPKYISREYTRIKNYLDIVVEKFNAELVLQRT